MKQTPDQARPTPRAGIMDIDAYVPAPIATHDIGVPASLVERLLAAHLSLAALGSTDVRHRLDGAARQLMRSEAIASSRLPASADTFWRVAPSPLSTISRRRRNESRRSGCTSVCRFRTSVTKSGD